MNGVARGTPWGYSLFEFEVWGGTGDSSGSGEPPAVTPVLISQNKSVTTSQVMGGNSGAAAVDGNMGTRWESNSTDDQYIRLDMGQSMHFTHVVLNWEGAYGKDYVIEISENASTWTQVSNVTNCNGGIDTLNLDGQKGRYIQMRGIQRGTGYGYSLFEFDVYGVPAVANLPLISFVTPVENVAIAQYSTIVFMNTTGDVFNASQESAFRAYMENGGGFVGTHAAADTEHDWEWYTDTLFAGAEFIHHGDGIPHARVVIEQPQNALVQHIGAQWMLGDEWYFWKTNPRNQSSVSVLGTLDRSSYNSNYSVADHPVIFTNTLGTGRMFYTAIGHVDANFSDPNMVEMFRKAIEWTSAN